MLTEADTERLRDAFPDLMLAPARATAVLSSTTMAMAFGVTGLVIAASLALLRSIQR